MPDVWCPKIGLENVVKKRRDQTYLI